MKIQSSNVNKLMVGSSAALRAYVGDKVAWIRPPIADYPMQDDAASTVVLAAIGSNAAYNGANTSAKTVTGPGGLYPKALSFDGSANSIVTPTIAFASRQVSVSYWVKAASWQTLARYFETSTNFSTGTFSTPRFASSMSTTTNQDTSYIRGEPPTYLHEFARTYGGWDHVVDIFDTTLPTTDGQQVDKYINGVLVTRIVDVVTSTTTNNFQSSSVYIANRFAADRGLAGEFAGFKIFNYRLSQEEITYLASEAD
jgi:hypothetical protein